MSFYWLSVVVVVVGVVQGMPPGNNQANPILGPLGYLLSVEMSMTVNYVNNIYPPLTAACTSANALPLEVWNGVTNSIYFVPNGLYLQVFGCEFTPSEYACIEDWFKHGPYSSCVIPGAYDVTVVSTLSLTLGTTTITFSTNDIPPMMVQADMGNYPLAIALPNNVQAMLGFQK